MDDDFDVEGFVGELTSEGTDSNDRNDPTVGLDLTLNTPGSWVPEDALANLVESRSASPEKDNIDIAKAMLEDNAPLAVQSIVNAALYSRSDAVRLRASQYIVDKAFESKAAGASVLEQFLEGIEAVANGSAKG